MKSRFQTPLLSEGKSGLSFCFAEFGCFLTEMKHISTREGAALSLLFPLTAVFYRGHVTTLEVSPLLCHKGRV